MVLHYAQSITYKIYFHTPKLEINYEFSALQSMT